MNKSLTVCWCRRGQKPGSRFGDTRDVMARMTLRPFALLPRPHRRAPRCPSRYDPHRAVLIAGLPDTDRSPSGSGPHPTRDQCLGELSHLSHEDITRRRVEISDWVIWMKVIRILLVYGQRLHTPSGCRPRNRTHQWIATATGIRRQDRPTRSRQRISQCQYVTA